MERCIVEGFQNLHVLPDVESVDHLARDFTLALDESSPRLHRKLPASRGTDVAGSITRHLTKKRRFKKRKSTLPINVGGAAAVGSTNISEGLDSSCSDSAAAAKCGLVAAHPDLMDTTIGRLSDSDDVLRNTSRLPRITIAAAQLIESDSVTENWSPLRPQRRRRHLRRMNVDGTDSACSVPPPTYGPQYEGQEAAADKSDTGYVSGLCVTATDNFHGKRKRGTKDRSGNNSFDLDLGCDESNRKCDCLMPESNQMLESASSSVSSVESEAEANSNEDAVDGDDEQSDYFAESECQGATGGDPRGCGNDIAGSVTLTASSAESFPWSSKYKIGDADCSQLDSSAQFDRLFRGGVELMSPTSRSHFKARFKLMTGRAFQSGRRRIKDRAQPPYSFTCFLHDRQLTGSGHLPLHCSLLHRPGVDSPGTGAGASWHRTPCNTPASPGLPWNRQAEAGDGRKAAICCPATVGGGGGSTDGGGGGGKRHRMMAKPDQMMDLNADEFVDDDGTLTHQSVNGWLQLQLGTSSTVTSAGSQPNFFNVTSDVHNS